jgi:hypothetical protein
MIRNFKTVFFVIILSTLVYTGIIYLAFNKNNTCDKLVRFNDGTQVEAKDVRSSDNGMTTIKICTDDVLRTPTLNIKMVEELKK